MPLDQQDRSSWDRGAIAEGIGLVTAALSRGSVGPYQVQAAIAAVHDEAPSAADGSIRTAARTAADTRDFDTSDRFIRLHLPY